MSTAEDFGLPMGKKKKKSRPISWFDPPPDAAEESQSQPKVVEEEDPWARFLPATKTPKECKPGTRPIRIVSQSCGQLLIRRTITETTSTPHDNGDDAATDTTAGITTPQKQTMEPKPSTLVARCRMCPRMAWLHSPTRNLADLAVPGSKGHDGVVLMCCARCKNSGCTARLAQVDVCPDLWAGSEMLAVATSLAGREMWMLGSGRGTAVVDLLALTQQLCDDESWGEIVAEKYAKGERGVALRSGEVKGGLI
jgi:hypothetical protein